MSTSELPPVHRRARRDVADGRLWKARDRLHGYLAEHPHHQPTLELLGDVCHRQGDLPAAGRYWLLTERADPDLLAARLALEERCGGAPVELLRTLDPRTPLDAYPPLARKRIDDLRDGVRRGGQRWEPRAPRVRNAAGTGRRSAPEAPSVGRRLLAPFALLVGPGLWFVGLATVVWLVVRGLS
jgi:hypothetical protein